MKNTSQELRDKAKSKIDKLRKKISLAGEHLKNLERRDAYEMKLNGRTNIDIAYDLGYRTGIVSTAELESLIERYVSSYKTQAVCSPDFYLKYPLLSNAKVENERLKQLCEPVKERCTHL